jgi:hypothetical protein
MAWQYRAPPDLTNSEARFAHFRQIQDERSAALKRLGWCPLSNYDDANLQVELERRYPLNGSRPPEPHTTWDVSGVYASPTSYSELESDLNLKVLIALRESTSPSEEVVAIDWQHPWYSFKPHALPLCGEPYNWAVPVLPDGDMFLFFPRDFRFGICGCPQTNTILFHGRQILDAIKANPPVLFSLETQRCEWGCSGECTITKS